MESLESLATVDLFKYVKREGLERLTAEMRLLSFPEGPIIKENDPPDGLYIIKSGMVRVSKAAGAGEIEAVLAILRPGNTFGELSLLDGEPRSASVTALQPVECYFLGRETFLSALQEHPGIAVAMLPGLATMVRNADRWVSSNI